MQQSDSHPLQRMFFFLVMWSYSLFTPKFFLSLLEKKKTATYQEAITTVTRVAADELIVRQYVLSSSNGGI